MTQFHSQCRSRYEVLVQKKKKASRASTSISGASQTNEPRSVDNVQLETQIQEAGPSSAPTHPRPRARTKKTSVAAPGVMDQTEQQPIERPRPRAKPQAKKSTRTAEQGDVVESEPIPELGGDKEKRKQKATAAPSESRKRKSRVVDDTGDNPPTKRKKSGLNAQPKSIATGKNLLVDNTTPEELPRPQLLETLSQGDGDTVTQVQAPTKDSRMKHTASATRRQPSRAVSKKSIS